MGNKETKTDEIPQIAIKMQFRPESYGLMGRFPY